MNSLLTQLPALFGVIVGAVATFGFSSLNERAKWRRSFSVRWDEKRLAAYSEYAAAVKIFVSTAWSVAAARGLPSTASPIPLDEGLQKLALAEAERSAKWETVQLLGDPATVSAARAWHRTAWELEWYARGKLDGADEFLDAWRRGGVARQNYYEVARKSLGVTSGALPIPPEQPAFVISRGDSPGAPDDR